MNGEVGNDNTTKHNDNSGVKILKKMVKRLVQNDDNNQLEASTQLQNAL